MATMKIPVMLADYPNWMFTHYFLAAVIVFPASICLLLAAAARKKRDSRAARTWLSVAGTWAALCIGSIIFGKIILRLA
jgi:hypothetical protein